MSMPPPPPPFNGGPPPPPGYSAYPSYSATDRAPDYAGFWQRFGAVFLDGLIALVSLVPGFIALFAGPTRIRSCTIDGDRGLCEVPTPGTIAVAALLFVAGFVSFLVLYTKKMGSGQTWGQKATGVRVVDSTSGEPIGTGRAVGRFFARYLSGFLCYLGYFWMLWDSRKQTWHDKLVSSIVVKA